MPSFSGRDATQRRSRATRTRSLSSAATTSRLPQAVEAVVFTGDDRSKAEAVHAGILGAYGLAASQVRILHVAPVKAWYTQWGIESFEET